MISEIMSSDSLELLSQPLQVFGSGGGSSGGGSSGGGSSGGGSSNGGGGSFPGGAFSEVPVSMDPGPFVDLNTLLANAVSPLLLEIRKLQKEVRLFVQNWNWRHLDFFGLFSQK